MAPLIFLLFPFGFAPVLERRDEIKKILPQLLGKHPCDICPLFRIRARKKSRCNNEATSRCFLFIPLDDLDLFFPEDRESCRRHRRAADCLVKVASQEISSHLGQVINPPILPPCTPLRQVLIYTLRCGREDETLHHSPCRQQ